MIRLFNIFCKLNFKTLSANHLFLWAMKDFSEEKIPLLKLACPNCGAKHPVWAYHDSYKRYLISYENQSITTDILDITRIICSSCKSTHAILPEIIIPFSSYSLLFILSVLNDYFRSSETVASLCMKYQISVSTLYEWKRLFLIHKKLWLGILEDIYQESIEFLSSMPDINTSEQLHTFFSNVHSSFLQGRTQTAHFNSG
ncbi:DUF6431 domain-containing protein [Desulfosporosinus sp. FKA]|uniref:DUF6431 domain-containing protein n=1 Tax=Desulfosporosinus sp. FKA TaxID=1969834 RepID=UPI000B4A037E|nr:DUF6431 domain-containing protein [Desulfosporosinus sp. FKA]